MVTLDEVLQYQYLLGLLLPTTIYIYFFLRKENRKIMLVSGFLYTLVLLFGFAMSKLKSLPEYVSISPGYWHPQTLFGLGEITGGLAIEDILFMFLSGGLVLVLCGSKKINLDKSFGKIFIESVLFGTFFSILFLYFTHKNLMYVLCAFYTAGAIYLIFKNRFNIEYVKIMTKNSFIFGTFYFSLFIVFIIVFPDFVNHNYNLASYGNKSFLGVPILEILHGFTFGAFWSMLFRNKV